jgi:hypothetical protein
MHTTSQVREEIRESMDNITFVICSYSLICHVYAASTTEGHWITAVHQYGLGYSFQPLKKTRRSVVATLPEDGVLARSFALQTTGDLCHLRRWRQRKLTALDATSVSCSTPHQVNDRGWAAGLEKKTLLAARLIRSCPLHIKAPHPPSPPVLHSHVALKRHQLFMGQSAIRSSIPASGLCHTWSFFCDGPHERNLKQM